MIGFFFFFTLVTGPRRSLSLKLSDTRFYEPQIRPMIGLAVVDYSNDVSTRWILVPVGSVGRFGSCTSHHRRTLELVLQKGHVGEEVTGHFLLTPSEPSVRLRV